MKSSIIAVSGGALLASALAVAPVSPAAAQEADQVEEITVTGSRIRRQDFTANSPVFTLDEANFENTATIGVETVLNQLPQFVPAVTQFTTTDVQNTANNTIGASTISLRGLGANRNLVLIDGRRVQPINPTMVVDTNMIPAAAIARVELMTGGASAVYGADAVGGVVNFILKDNFEGASVDVRYGDTQHGGNQEVTISALIGANAGDRGNVMFGVERSTRSKQLQWERDWRVDDMRNPATPATAFGWGSDTWISNNAFNLFNWPDQNAVNALFDQAEPCTPGSFFAAGVCPTDPQTGTNLGVPNNVRFLLNRPSGTIYTGLMQSSGAAGSYRYEGPYNEDNYGNFTGLPFRVVQPDGTLKENNFWQWASIPLERLSAFAKGHFDASDNIRVTGQALVTRTENLTSLGLTADNITFWGAPVPFGTTIYTGNPTLGIPSSLNANGTTNANYLPGGRFGVNCDAQPTAAEPWHDGLPGCTETEAWPVPLEVWNLYRTRPNPEADIWANRPPDYLRQAIGASRSGESSNTTMQYTLGVEGDLPSGNDFWDISVSTGRTDSLVIQRGSSRLSTYRAMMASPNYGRGAIFDPNPYITGFAESIATCTSGLPIMQDFPVSMDCVTMMSPDLKNKTQVTQTVLEANLNGELVDMPAGPLGYAVGYTYREDAYEFEPDNLSQNQNFIDPIAGLFPNQNSAGEFDVSELYGEMLIPIVSDGPTGVEHFSFELGARMSDWSMPLVDTLTTYKFLIDWGITERYRMRGGFNRAFRAPNLGELFIARTQIFGGVANQFGDQCSQNSSGGPFSANPAVAGAQQAAATEAICRALMGPAGAAEYYDNRPITAQPTVGGVGIQNSTGNPNLQEEQADTFTLGMVMDFLDGWTLTLDYYQIEITEMIAVESPDSVYERCLSLDFNPTSSITAPGCLVIYRDPTNGNPANIDLSYTNAGRVQVSGLDLQLNWNKPLGAGTFNLNTVANYNIESVTQDRPELSEIDWAGTQGCALQIQCQGYDYRIFTSLSYFQGPWSISVRHQFWPKIDAGACISAPTSAGCRFGGVQENYQLFSLAGSYSFNDRYTIRVGIDNLLDEEPPYAGGNPEQLPFGIPQTHVGGSLGAGAGASYDPLGRRMFVSMAMDF